MYTKRAKIRKSTNKSEFQRVRIRQNYQHETEESMNHKFHNSLKTRNCKVNSIKHHILIKGQLDEKLRKFIRRFQKEI